MSNKKEFNAAFFGLIVRKQIESMKLTANSLSQKTGVSTYNIYGIIEGGTPELVDFLILCQALDIHPAYFLREQKTPKNETIAPH